MAPEVSRIYVDFGGESPAVVALTLADTLLVWEPDNRYFHQQLLYYTGDTGSPQPFNACMKTLAAVIAEPWPEFTDFRGLERAHNDEKFIGRIVVQAIALALRYATGS